MKKVIINACLTGMIPSKEDNSKVPVTPQEIISSALECASLGASIVHIHPRDESGKPTWKREVFEKIIAGIREKNDKLLISVTTSGRFWDDFDKRSEVLGLTGDLKPDLASLTVGSMNFMRDQSVNSPEIIVKLAEKMMDNNIKPELEVFEPGMVHKANYLIEKGVISKDSPYFNIFLGSLGTSPLNPSSFAAFYNLLPQNAVWAIAGVGRFQLDANILGLSMGGGVRVGLEDNLYMDREKKIKASNESLVSRIVDIAEKIYLEICSASETREILKIK